MSDKMNPEIKAKWVAALRSGDYKQGTGVLRSEWDEYCCLGVLCDIAEKEGVPMIVVEPAADGDVSDGIVGAYYYFDGDRDTGDYEITPSFVAGWAGLPSVNPSVELTDPYDEDAVVLESLADLNDGGKSFDEMADIIEEHL